MITYYVTSYNDKADAEMTTQTDRKIISVHCLCVSLKVGNEWRHKNASLRLAFPRMFIRTSRMFLQTFRTFFGTAIVTDYSFLNGAPYSSI